MSIGHEMDANVAQRLFEIADLVSEIRASQGRTEAEVSNIKSTLSVLPKMDERIAALESVKYKMLGVAGISGGGAAGAWEFIQNLFKHVK